MIGLSVRRSGLLVREKTVVVRIEILNCLKKLLRRIYFVTENPIDSRIKYKFVFYYLAINQIGFLVVIMYRINNSKV